MLDAGRDIFLPKELFLFFLYFSECLRMYICSISNSWILPNSGTGCLQGITKLRYRSREERKHNHREIISSILTFISLSFLQISCYWSQHISLDLKRNLRNFCYVKNVIKSEKYNFCVLWVSYLCYKTTSLFHQTYQPKEVSWFFLGKITVLSGHIVGGILRDTKVLTRFENISVRVWDLTKYAETQCTELPLLGNKWSSHT